MALATANPRKGTCGDLKVQCGTWTGSRGDASGSLTVEGMTLYAASFNTNDTTGPYQSVPYTWTSTGNIITITIHNRENVTEGTYFTVSA